MDPAAEPLLFYGHASDARSLGWPWVEKQLTEAGTYWDVARGAGHPHPRPVWGLWQCPRLYLSIGGPIVTRQLVHDARVTVHLDSGTDVVIVEGVAAGPDVDSDVLQHYNAKYDWDYSVADYGPLTVVIASTVLAWRSGGWAGRDGFQESSRWRFPA